MTLGPGPLAPDTSVRIGPWYTVTQIAQMCRELSDTDSEVYARVESLNGQPVAYFVRAPRGDLLAGFRRQAE